MEEATIAVHVGSAPEIKTFVMSKSRLTQCSGFFRTIIDNIDRGLFAEGAAGSITLGEESATTFTVFDSWLSSGGEQLSIPDSGATAKYQRLFKLWIFGDRRFIPLLQNLALSTIWCLVQETQSLPLDFTPLAYANTNEQSALRRFIIYCHAPLEPHRLLSYVVSHSHWYNEDALHDLLPLLDCRRPRLSSTEFRAIDLCSFYHIHEPRGYCNA